MKILDIPRSGSYAGLTSSKNRFGQYVRNRRAPVQPIGTGRRAFIRAAFGAASGAWAVLSPTQQAAWDGFAESHPIVNSLGASVILTGHQMYVAVQTQRQNVGLGLEDMPPEAVETPTLSEVTFTLDQTPTVTVAGEADQVGFGLVAFSPPLSPGRRFPTRFWQAGVVALTDDSFTSAQATAFVAEFGGLILDNRVFVKVTPVNAEGWTGTPTILNAQVVAAPGP